MKNLFYLIVGNITFHHFSDEELKLFKNPDAEQKALIHEVDDIHVFFTADEANEVGEEFLGNGAESYLVIGGFNGEVIFEKESDLALFNKKVSENGEPNIPETEPEKRLDYIIVDENNKWLATGRNATQKNIDEDIEFIRRYKDTELTVFSAPKFDVQRYERPKK